MQPEKKLIIAIINQILLQQDSESIMCKFSSMPCLINGLYLSVMYLRCHLLSTIYNSDVGINADTVFNP